MEREIKNTRENEGLRLVLQGKGRDSWISSSLFIQEMIVALPNKVIEIFLC